MIDINLLPYEKRTSKFVIRMIILFALVCLLALILMTIYTIHLNHELQQAQQQENKWEARSQVKQTYKSGQQKQNNLAMSEAEAVLKVKTTRIPLFDTLVKLQRQLPVSGMIQQLTFDSSGNTTLKCGLNSFNDMKQFIVRLRRQPFNHVELTQINSTQTHSSGNAESLSPDSGKYQVSLTLRSLINKEAGQ